MKSSACPPSTIWLVRHGETDWNEAGRIQGHLDAAQLTELGRRQASSAAAGLPSGSVEAIYSSDLCRARQTAEIIATRLRREVRTDRRLRERSFGFLEGLGSECLTSQVTGIDEGNIVDADARPPEGESLDQVRERCADFLRWLADQPRRGDVVVVAHGGTVRMLQAAAEESSLVGRSWGEVANGSIRSLVLLDLVTVPLSMPDSVPS